MAEDHGKAVGITVRVVGEDATIRQFDSVRIRHDAPFVGWGRSVFHASTPTRETHDPMGMPGWWGERRYGIYLDASLATVPAWAPIGAAAERYRSHLGEVVGDEGVASEPFVEVLAHHRDRWGHLGSYDDFAPLLDFDEFDAEEWAEFVVRSGAGYAAITTRHDDGWCWWDAPSAARTMLDVGPRRNVVAEFAAACERNDLVLGGFYSLVRETAADPDERRDQLRDLIERVGIELLFSNIGGRPPTSLQPDGIGRDPAVPVERALDPRAVTDIVLDRAVAELLGSTTSGCITSFASDLPDDIVTDPWQVCRPTGASLCRNRTETDTHQLTAVEIVATLTEVVAKGGNLLIGIGPTAGGAIAGPGCAPLLGAGDWIRGHDHLLRDARPWSSWGDAGAHYWVANGALHVADIAGDGRFGMADTDDRVVDRILRVSPSDGATPDGSAVPFEHDEDGIQLSATHSRRGRRQHFPLVYRIETSRRERGGELFAPTPPKAIPLAPLLSDAQRGEIVQLGDAVYDGPGVVRPGVTLRGLGPDRTRISTHDGPVTLGADARLEHLAIVGPTRSGTDEPAAQLVVEGERAIVLGCAVDGLASIAADGVTVRATRLQRLRTSDADRPRISHCQFAGDRWSTGVELVGGSDAEIDSNEFAGHRRAIHVVESSGAAISGNHIESHHCGVHLERAEHTHVHGNLVIGTMRAVDVDGGSHAVIDGNAVFDGDSGCVVRGGAADCEISGNHWERCRIGVLGWNAGEIREVENHGVDLYEPEHLFVSGP
ncbi:MAG: alpha-L-fucosidase [Acidimicrobiia bacterium]|nr:alpha-L-fucosidase [Acidimicrobiia bacterium]